MKQLFFSALGVFLSVSVQAAPWPAAQLTAADAQVLREDQFVSIDQHRDWQVDLDLRGLRAAGSPAHEAYIDALRERLKKAGVPEVYEEPVTLRRWSVSDWSLEAGGMRLPTASFVPYSGITGPEGVSGSLRSVSDLKQVQPGSLSGKIALVEFKKPETTLSVFEKDAWVRHDPEGTVSGESPYIRIYFISRQMVAALDMLKKAGASGAIIILDEPAQNALGLYAPYDGLNRDVPALYVDEATGQSLKELAADQQRVTLRAQGAWEEVQSRNLIGIIPGMSDELVVLNSHTDGPNGIEDNGPNIIVGMAQYLARLPREALPRSVMVLLTTGHFSGAAGGNEFVEQHQGDGMLERMAAVLCLEHMGAEEWVSGPGGRWMPTGKAEPFWFFMPNIPPLIKAAEEALERSGAAPVFIRPPTRAYGKGDVHDHVWPGEGQVFWARSRIPTANYISGPNYLLNWGISTADKVDYGRLFRETIAFTEMTLKLGRTPMHDLRPDHSGDAQ